jgi:hypothetical protein
MITQILISNCFPKKGVLVVLNPKLLPFGSYGMDDDLIFCPQNSYQLCCGCCADSNLDLSKCSESVHKGQIHVNSHVNDE